MAREGTGVVWGGNRSGSGERRGQEWEWGGEGMGVGVVMGGDRSGSGKGRGQEWEW